MAIFSVRRLDEPEDKTEYYDTDGPRWGPALVSFAVERKITTAVQAEVKRWDPHLKKWEEVTPDGITIPGGIAPGQRPPARRVSKPS